VEAHTFPLSEKLCRDSHAQYTFVINAVVVISPNGATQRKSRARFQAKTKPDLILCAGGMCALEQVRLMKSRLKWVGKDEHGKAANPRWIM